MKSDSFVNEKNTNKILTALIITVIPYAMSFILGFASFLPAFVLTVVKYTSIILLYSSILFWLENKSKADKIVFKIFISLALMILISTGIIFSITNQTFVLIAKAFPEKTYIQWIKFGFNIIIETLIVKYILENISDTLDNDIVNNDFEGGKLKKILFAILGIIVLTIYFIINTFRPKTLFNYGSLSIVNVILIFLVFLLIFAGIASSIGILIVDNDIGFKEEWHKCYNCDGTGKVTNDFGWKVKCPRCDGVGNLYY